MLASVRGDRVIAVICRAHNISEALLAPDFESGQATGVLHELDEVRAELQTLACELSDPAFEHADHLVEITNSIRLIEAGHERDRKPLRWREHSAHQLRARQLERRLEPRVWKPRRKRSDTPTSRPHSGSTATGTRAISSVR